MELKNSQNCGYNFSHAIVIPLTAILCENLLLSSVFESLRLQVIFRLHVLCDIIWATAFTSRYCINWLGFVTFTKLRKATISLVMSARPFIRPPAWNISAPAGRILMEYVWDFFRKCPEYCNVIKIRKKITDTLHETVFTFVIKSS